MVTGCISAIPIAAVAAVPPERPPFTSHAVVHSPMVWYSPFTGGSDLRVLFARKAQVSEGTESKPHEGTTITLFLVAL